MKRYLIIFHRVDYDGIFSAVVAKRAYEDRKDGVVELLGYNYGDPLEHTPEELISLYDEICMVDISFNDVEIMGKLYESHKTILIDHHETCLNLLKNNGMCDWEGFRKIGEGACSLTFQYFYPESAVPSIIMRLSLYDVWNHSVLDWNMEILPLQYFLRTHYGMSIDSVVKDADYLFNEGEIDYFLDEGKLILKYLNKTWKSWVKTYSFEVSVAGRFKGICMLTPQFGSQPFESSEEFNKYQVVVCANKKKKVLNDGTVTYVYTASLYSTSDKIGDFSLGEYVKEITQTGIGGGHAGAAGIELTEEQFVHLVTHREI